jgi:hypothetical protein
VLAKPFGSKRSTAACNNDTNEALFGSARCHSGQWSKICEFPRFKRWRFQDIGKADA